MTNRDRMVLICVAAVVLLGAFYLKLVSPERKQVAKLTTEISAANTQLSSAEGSLASARHAQSQYASAYASAVELGKAVPTQPEVSSLIFEIDTASQNKNVDFNSITSGSSAAGSGSSAGASSSSHSGSSSTPAAAPTTFTQLPFTFTFEGGFSSLSHLLETIEGFTKTASSGQLQVTGRLLTIQTVKLSAPSSTATVAHASSLSGTITATAYVLPGSTGVSTPSTSSSSSTSTPSSSSSTSSPTTPAVARVAP